MKNFEQLIWNYLDGIASEEERKHTEQLLESDSEFLTLFEELSAIHLQISALELDEPSMSFSRNLIEKIQLEPSPVPPKSLADKWVIYGIALFFVSSIVCLLGLLLSKIDWTQSGDLMMPELTMPKLTFDGPFYSLLINLFIFVDIICALYFFDLIISRRINSKNNPKG